MLSLRDDLISAIDPVGFARRCGLEPDRWQGDLLRSEADRVLLNCSRQSGKSTIAGVVATRTAVFEPGALVLVLAPSLRQSQEIFQKIIGAYEEAWRPVPAVAVNKLSLELINGSRIVALPGSEKTVRGFSGASLLIVDEAARVDDALYYTVRPMLAVSGGRLLMLSTPFGKRGAFYETWTKGGAAWDRYEVPATECPRISPEFLEEERKELPVRVFKQEYLCEFQDAQDSVFDGAAIERATGQEAARFRSFSLDIGLSAETGERTKGPPRRNNAAMPSEPPPTRPSPWIIERSS